MKSSRRLLFLFAGSVLLPGLMLAYLSFRSVKDERLLLEKSLDGRNLAFLNALDQLLQKTRREHFSGLESILRQGGSAETPNQAWSIASVVLESPLVQSVVVFQGDTAVFPRALETWENNGAMHVQSHPLIPAIRREWKLRRYSPCLREIRTLLHGPDSLAKSEFARFGFRLLELKCLFQLEQDEELIQVAQTFIRNLQESKAFDSYQAIGFYLDEAINLLTSLESLPRPLREEFFKMHQQLPIFLSNAEFVQHAWPAPPEEILRSILVLPEDSLRAQYHEGIPFLRAGFPWLNRDSQVLLRLNEAVFVEAVRSEMLQERRETWKDVDFAILNRKDEIVLASDSVADREPSLERSLEDAMPSWRIVVYKKPASELQSIGRRRMALQYVLLGFSLLALMLGTFALFQGLGKEQRMVKMKTNFLSAVSHELKTPLTAIRMFAEILSSGRQQHEDKKRQYADRIGHEAERLQAMIEGILSFTRLEEDPNALNRIPMDLGELAQEMAGLLNGAFVKAGLRLTVHASMAPLVADPDALRSVLQNLLENALKYSRPNTEVVLEIIAREHEVVLRVADQGIGIPPEDLKHIFDKFFRSGDEMTRKTKGSGLGLALVKRIVDAHHGTIDVRSALGQGTEMNIVFPKQGVQHAPNIDR